MMQPILSILNIQRVYIHVQCELMPPVHFAPRRFEGNNTELEMDKLPFTDAKKHNSLLLLNQAKTVSSSNLS